MKPLSLILAFLFATPVWAAKDPFASEPAAYVGLVGGLSIPTAQNTTERTAIGAEVGAKLSDEFGVGLLYLSSAKGERGNGGDFAFAYSAFGVEANYYFEGTAQGAHLGGRLGLGRVSKDVNSKSYSYSPFFYGIQVGYDYKLGEHFSLGAEGNAMFFNGGTKDETTGLSVGAFDTLNLLLTAKAWF